MAYSPSRRCEHDVDAQIYVYNAIDFLNTRRSTHFTFTVSNNIETNP